MDLGAYAQIDDLEKIAKANNIEIPRLRGYRLMKDEKPVSVEEIEKLEKNFEAYICKDLCEALPFWDANSCCSGYRPKTEYLFKRYLIEQTDEDGCKIYTGVRWDRIHGKKRKILKFEIKKKKREIQKQYEAWNKYADKENILYIHARIGGNWNYYGGSEIEKQPWFLEKANDCFDGTYCDIYAQINK